MLPSSRRGRLQRASLPVLPTGESGQAGGAQSTPVKGGRGVSISQIAEGRHYWESGQYAKVRDEQEHMLRGTGR